MKIQKPLNLLILIMIFPVGYFLTLGFITYSNYFWETPKHDFQYSNPNLPDFMNFIRAFLESPIGLFIVVPGIVFIFIVVYEFVQPCNRKV